MLVTLYKIGEVYFCLLGTNHGFHVKAENDERFTAVGSRCHHNLNYENFTLSFGRLRQKLYQNVPAHAARLFVFFQPIKLRIFDVVVAVVVS